MGPDGSGTTGHQCFAAVRELLKERMSTDDGSATEAVERLANFGKRHRLSLRGLKIKDLINEGRR